MTGHRDLQIKFSVGVPYLVGILINPPPHSLPLHN